MRNRSGWLGPIDLRSARLEKMLLPYADIRAEFEQLAGAVNGKFAGAAKELSEALIVNPYDVNEMAQALKRRERCHFMNIS
jgi:hypothetical protein